ncbi:hypothetical protein ACIQD5_35820 [Streptomyces microflavus]|uniref:hypothetical protein n=1 Tax=Streptomyces microflavus TaxID=1919 RepID=UPI0038266D84
MGPDGRLIDGNAGVDAGTTSTLAIVPCVLSDADWLTPDQHLRLLAVVNRMCATLDHASRPDTPGLATEFEHTL